MLLGISGVFRVLPKKKEGGRWKIEVEDKCLENAIFHLFNLLITIC